MLDGLERAAELDTRLRDITSERDGLRARVNALSKQVGEHRRKGETAEAEALQEESRTIGDTEKLLAEEHDEVTEVPPETIQPPADDNIEPPTLGVCDQFI